MVQELVAPAKSSSAESKPGNDNPESQPEKPASGAPVPMDVDESGGGLIGKINNSSIVCCHGGLDPLKGRDMKVVFSVSKSWPGLFLSLTTPLGTITAPSSTCLDDFRCLRRMRGHHF